jgi:tagatose-6-phosphate ketose/aldose isomerase
MNALKKLLQLQPSEMAAQGLEHTPREIAQQPETWHETFARIRARAPEIREFLKPIVAHNRNRQLRVTLIGAGSSDYIGRALVHLLRRQWKCDVAAVPSTDLVTDLRHVACADSGELWISFSRSGSTPESVAVLDRALKEHPRAKHIVVSCDMNGKMLRNFAGHPNVLGLCLSDEVNDRGVAMTSSVTNMLIAGQCLAHINCLDMYREKLDALSAAARQLIVHSADQAAEFASSGYKHVAFVGSGPFHAVATESALKVLELTGGRVLTMSESVLGFRHGPIAALGGKSLVVSYLPTEPHARRHTIDLLQEIRAKRLAATTVLLSWSSEGERDLPADVVIRVSEAPMNDDCRAPADIIFGQFLGLFFSLQSGLRPDSPSPNGALNRVVQGVRL